jgi:DNA-binding IclR family transcriptional regulator
MADELNSTEKVLMILKAFLPDNRPRGTLELSHELGIKPATASRLLGILKEHQFVYQNENRKYQLGEAATALGEAANESKTVRQIELIRPHLMRLNGLLNENVNLEILFGNHLRITVVLPGTKSVNVTARPGKLTAINATASGKAILAFLPPDRLRGIMKAHPVLTKFLPNTLTDWEDLKNQFKEIRKSGVAYDRLEYREEICAVATPVFNHSGAVFGAVSIPVPVQREAIIFEKKTTDLLKATARKITASLGDLPPV